MIACSCDFCIYENDGLCTLKNIEIGKDGTCGNCIFFDIDDYAKTRLKEITLKKLEDRYK